MSNILCGKSIETDVKTALELCAMVVTDSNLAKLYGEYTDGAYVIPAGEVNKTPETLFKILEEMRRRKLKRGDRVAAFGGGVVGDVTGFAAAIYMRGIRWASIPTSLLAMVDSGIGGKTAVDFCGVKNLIGAFHEPEDIIIDTAFLKTLPEREWLCGTGELIKTCLLDGEAYRAIKDGIKGLRAKDESFVFSLVKRCADIKNGVVETDFKEAGLRKILNIGHTVGHALESLDGFKLSHGEYVLKGLMTEMTMCREFADEKFYREVIELLLSFTSPPRTTAKACSEKASLDKKNEGDAITLMIPVSAGDIKEVKLDESEFISRYEDAIKELKKQ